MLLHEHFNRKKSHVQKNFTELNEKAVELFYRSRVRDSITSFISYSSGAYKFLGLSLDRL